LIGQFLDGACYKLDDLLEGGGMEGETDPGSRVEIRPKTRGASASA
jgi:hypothetical protein